MKLDSLIGISVTAISRPQDILTIDGENKLVYGAFKEVSGWVSLFDSGIMPKDLLGVTLKFRVKLTVTSAELPSADPNTIILSLVENSSDLTVESFKENLDDPFVKGIEEVLSEKVNEGHRFTGFVEDPKDL